MTNLLPFPCSLFAAALPSRLEKGNQKRIKKERLQFILYEAQQFLFKAQTGD